jgi:hypothetical protein
MSQSVYYIKFKTLRFRLADHLQVYTCKVMYAFAKEEATGSLTVRNVGATATLGTSLEKNKNDGDKPGPACTLSGNCSG